MMSSTVRSLFGAAILVTGSALGAVPLVAQTPVQPRLRIEPAAGVAVATVELAVERGWKLYARDPGEAGLPLRIEWVLPDGWSGEEVEWPDARATTVFGVPANIHEGVVRISRIVRPSDTGLSAAPVLSVRLQWAACREVCVPGDTVLHARLPGRP